MKYSILLVCLMILLTGCIVGNEPISNPTSNTTEVSTEIYEQEANTPAHPRTPGSFHANNSKVEIIIHKLVNERREENELSPLVYDKRLAAIGRYHSWEMAEYEYFSHNGSGGLTFEERRQLFDYNCSYSGENIVFHPGPLDAFSKEDYPIEVSIARQVVASLMNSPSHRNNMFKTNYVVQGIGVFITQDGKVYVSQEFCG